MEAMERHHALREEVTTTPQQACNAPTHTVGAFASVGSLWGAYSRDQAVFSIGVLATACASVGAQSLARLSVCAELM